MYNDGIYSPLSHHIEYFHFPKNPPFSTYSSLPLHPIPSLAHLIAFGISDLFVSIVLLLVEILVTPKFWQL
jgi:hypothetical protein